MPPKKATAAKTGPLAGKTIVFTGTLKIPRPEAKKLAEAAGAKVGTSVSKNTHFLIAGEDSGSKIEDAEAKGVEVWDQEKFFALVQGDSEEPESKVEEEESAPKKGKASKASATKPTAEDSSSISGKTIVFTGTLSISRAQAKKLAEKAGAKVTTSISKNTHILVAGEDSGSKIEDAEEKGVEIWTESQFSAAAGGGGEDEVEEEEEKPKPVKKSAPKKVTGKRGKKKAEEEEDEEEEAEEEEEEKPKKKGKSEPAPTPTPTPAPSGGGGESAGPRERHPDSFMPAASNYKVHENYDVYLNQTNLTGTTQGNNKYYIIQLLETPAGSYGVWTRWGRVGENNLRNSNLENHSSNLDAAKKAFNRKFKDKTGGNNFDDLPSFTKVAGKYMFVEKKEGEKLGDGGIPPLSVAQIEKGQAVLNQLKELLDGGKSKGSSANELSGQYYSLVPTNTGRKAPPVLNSMELIATQEALLEFWLRMGFDDMEEKTGVSPIDGVMERPVPASLKQAAARISDSGSINSAVSRGSQLAKSQAGDPVKHMNQELYGAILLYTGNSIYADLNRCLRSEDRKQVMKYFDYLRLFMESMEYMPKNSRTLWRGISVDLYDQYEEGKVITWWSVSSCTADQQVAKNFMAGCGGNCTLLTLECRTAMDIQALSFYANEKESLLAPGTQLRVISRRRNGKVSEIHVEEIGRVFA